LQWVKVGKHGDVGERNILEGISMYSFALILDPAACVTEFSHHATRAALFYNLAHIHHWRAMHLGVSSLLPLALEYYEQAGQAIEKTGGDRDLVIDHLALAVLNNMGHVHCQLLQFNQAQYCFNVLRLMISKRVGSLSLLQAMEDYETFVLSAMLVPELRLAPAA
jgi:hypothetical protein